MSEEYYHIKVWDDGALDLWINDNPDPSDSDTWDYHVVKDSEEECREELCGYGYEDDRIQEFIDEAKAERKLLSE